MSIQVRNIRKQFGSYIALDDISLDFHTGELVALLGPSGCGKTTLLRVIAGLEQADSGQVILDGTDASATHVREREVGFVFQHYALFRHMTVFDNVAFGLRMKPRGQRPTEKQISEKVHQLLSLVQLEWLAKRFPSQLSGGQRQRIALARALAVEPRVLLLDEPFGALDAQVRRELRKWLREIHDRTGHTTVFVTHDQEEALELSDRLCVMSQGRIEQVGSPDEVYDHPSSPFVFGFIGESSTLPVSVENGEVWSAGRALGLPAQGFSGDKAHLYFRPHDVDLVDAEASLAGVVTASRRVGGTRRVELAIGGEGHKVEIDLPFDHPAGEKTRLAFRPRRWKLFPAD